MIGQFVREFALDLQIGFLVLSLIFAYWYWIRPVLRERPGCLEFYNHTDNFWAAVNIRFQGLKGKIATGVAKAATIIVLLHDQVIPAATGVDWSPLVGQVPGWAWPLITFFAFWFIGKCREWAEARQ